MKEEIGLFLIFLAILIFKLSFIDDELDFAEKVKEFLIASLSMGVDNVRNAHGMGRCINMDKFMKIMTCILMFLFVLEVTVFVGIAFVSVIKYGGV